MVAVLKKAYTKLIKFFDTTRTKIMFRRNSVHYGNDFITRGIPYVKVNRSGKFSIGNGFKMNNNFAGNIIGRQQKCIFVVKGNLFIRNNVGISSSAIVCHNFIEIGSNVTIGGNTAIYDTDFHSLKAEERTAMPEILEHVKTKPVIIEDNVFIGAHSLILKGTTIGRNSIVGAGSVVSKSIPPFEIWAGNPAKKIREIAE
jgi:acetyltransferase-like isoleucine patch superfamily enzyme